MMKKGIIKPTCMKVATHFLKSDEYDSKTIEEVKRATGLSYNTVSSAFKILFDSGMLYVDKTVGKVKLYKKTQSPDWNALRSFLTVVDGYFGE